MTRAARLERDRTALVVVDVQEGFRPVIDRFDDVVGATARLVQGARVLGLPVVVTEQYPKGLGETVSEVLEHLDGVVRHPKTVFAATQAEGFDLEGRGQAIVCGIEAHICVNQTVSDLLAQGVHVEVAVDAIGSRAPGDKDVALHRMEADGARRTSTETALFELLGAAGGDEFKAIQRIIK